MSSRDEIDAEIQRIKASLDEADAVMAALETDVQAMADQEAGNGHYGIAGSYVSAREQAEQVTVAIRRAGSGLESMRVAIAATAGSMPSSTPGAPADGPVAFDLVATQTAVMKAIARYVGKQKTVGQLLDTDGRLIGGEIWSGRDGPARGGADLAYRWSHMTTMLEHVEGHVAAIMRRDGIREATLIISRRPCDNQPYGCEWTLEDCLPEGSRLTIKTVDRAGEVQRTRVFNGTGRAINQDRS